MTGLLPGATRKLTCSAKLLASSLAGHERRFRKSIEQIHSALTDLSVEALFELDSAPAHSDEDVPEHGRREKPGQRALEALAVPLVGESPAGAIGSAIFPVIGTVIGSILGSIIGGVVGGSAGEFVGGKVYEETVTIEVPAGNERRTGHQRHGADDGPSSERDAVRQLHQMLDRSVLGRDSLKRRCAGCGRRCRSGPHFEAGRANHEPGEIGRDQIASVLVTDDEKAPSPKSSPEAARILEEEFGGSCWSDGKDLAQVTEDDQVEVSLASGNKTSCLRSRMVDVVAAAAEGEVKPDGTFVGPGIAVTRVIPVNTAARTLCEGAGLHDVDEQFLLYETEQLVAWLDNGLTELALHYSAQGVYLRCSSPSLLPTGCSFASRAKSIRRR